MAQAAASNCDICTGGPGEHYCQQCDQLFCGSCKLSHLRAKSCKNHTFLSGPNINREENVRCTEHEEMFLLYCNDCDTPVCKICTVEKHSRHLMTDLTKSTVKLRYELSKIIDAKIKTSKLGLSKIEKETKEYREEVKAVIKTITDEGNHWKNLIDKKVDGFVKQVQDKEQKALHYMSVLTKDYRGVFENCQQWHNNIKKLESIADVLLLQKLKKLEVDVDNMKLKEVPERSSVSYRNKKPPDTEIDSLFGELQFKPKESQKLYKYVCSLCRNEQVLTKKPNINTDYSYRFIIQGLSMECNNRECEPGQRWHSYLGIEDY